jgi:hypothetical protein
MGFDVATFNQILAAGFDLAWNRTPIPRDDAHSTGKTRPGARSLDAAGALGLLLHYLNSTMREISLRQIFSLIPTTISRYITFGLKLLLPILRTMPDATIRWPEHHNDFRAYNELIVARHPRLTGAFASIDGLNLACQTSDDEEIENATYNGWLCEHFVSSVLVFSPEGDQILFIWCKVLNRYSGTVIAANLNAPGSWHDSRIARPIYEKLRARTPDGFYLVADTAFPRGVKQIEGKICAPIKSGQRMQGKINEIQERIAFDTELLSYRQTAE